MSVVNLIRYKTTPRTTNFDQSYEGFWAASREQDVQEESES